jgi:hypothetical protein
VNSTAMTKEEKRFNKFELKAYKRSSACDLTNVLQDSVLAPKITSVSIVGPTRKTDSNMKKDE